MRFSSGLVAILGWTIKSWRSASAWLYDARDALVTRQPFDVGIKHALLVRRPSRSASGDASLPFYIVGDATCWARCEWRCGRDPFLIDVVPRQLGGGDNKHAFDDDCALVIKYRVAGRGARVDVRTCWGPAASSSSRSPLADARRSPSGGVMRGRRRTVMSATLTHSRGGVVLDVTTLARHVMCDALMTAPDANRCDWLTRVIWWLADNGAAAAATGSKFISLDVDAADGSHSRWFAATCGAVEKISR